MHRILAGAACIGLVSPSIVAAQSAERVLAPSSNWYLDGGETRCRLLRKFGEGPDAHLFFLETDQPSAYASFLIAGPTLEKIDWSKSIEIQLGDLEKVELQSAHGGDFEGFGSALMNSSIWLGEPKTEIAPQDDKEASEEVSVEAERGLPRIVSERFSEVSRLSVTQGEENVISLELRGFAKALEALNLCSENFVSYWGLDLEKHRSMQHGPKLTNLDEIARRVVWSYRGRALRRGEQGTVRFLVMVDELGQVTSCRQSNATEFESLESPICKEIARAQFEPARDAKGQPMRSYYASSVRYTLPSR